jgi:hypothetical protein
LLRACVFLLIFLFTVRKAVVDLPWRNSMLSSIVASHAAAASGEGSATWCGLPLALKSIDCFKVSQNRLSAAKYIADHTAPGERIYVGLDRHDKIFVNDNVTYFVASRLPATRWHHFDPGLQNSEGIQREMIVELQAASTRYLVLTSEWEEISEPNESARSSGVHLLDDYIRVNYRPIERYGAMTVWLRQPG